MLNQFKGINHNLNVSDSIGIDLSETNAVFSIAIHKQPYINSSYLTENRPL